jgi:hypothetical protein
MLLVETCARNSAEFKIREQLVYAIDDDRSLGSPAERRLP